MSLLAVFVGPPGAGKTTVASAVARRLGAAFRDTDFDVEAAEQMSIADLFVVKGEPYFREREHEAVRMALADHDGVLALGGGAVMDDRTRALLADVPVIHLDVGLGAAVARTGMSGQRPLLLGNVRGRLKRMLDERRPLYAEVADVTIVTDDMTADDVVEQALAWIAQGAR